MSRRISIFTSIFLTLSVSTSTSYATATPSVGKNCGHLNQVQQVGNQKFVCLPVNAHIAVWKKYSTSVPSTAKGTSPSSPPVPIASPTQAGVPAFVPPVVPVSFQDLDSHLSGITYGAWLNGSKHIQASTPTLGNVKILIGPNTQVADPKPLDAFAKASALYFQSQQVKNLYLIEFSKADSVWAQQQYDLLHPKNYDPDAAVHQCHPNNGCIGAQAGVNAAGDGVIIYGMGGIQYPGPDGTPDPRQTNGDVLAHEYTHTIQMLNAPCNSGPTCYGQLPQWTLEGNADWSGLLDVSTDSYQSYMKFRGNILESIPGNSKLSQFTPAWVTTYLNPNPTFVSNQDNWSYWHSNPIYSPDWAYSIGAMVDEVLTSLKGPESVMNLYKDAGAGLSFVQAFQQEFGISWADACPILGKVISGEIQQGLTR